MNLYQLIPHRKDDHTAIAKAPADVMFVAERLGFEKLDLNPYQPKSSGVFERLIKLILWEIAWRRCLSKIKNPAFLLIQGQPDFWCRRAARHFIDGLKRKGVKIVTLYHDLPELREAKDVGFYRGTTQATVDYSDLLIAHNAAMKAKLVEYGADPKCVLELGVFDYLYRGPVFSRNGAMRNGRYSIVVAGNMAASKSAYLAKLKEVDGVEWRLYGPNYSVDEIDGKNITYCGSFPPDELPRHLQGDFGLVWDGNSIETCGGVTGEYLRYNSPHKLSLYLACDIPVIIWSQAAEAEFVKKNNLGLVVDSLFDLPSALSQVSGGAYAKMIASVRIVSEKVREGGFCKEVLCAALQK